MQLTEQQVHDIMRRASTEEDYRLTIDLERQIVADDRDAIASFQIDPFVKYRFLNGLDDIGLTLQHVDEIGAFEARRWPLYPRTIEAA